MLAKKADVASKTKVQGKKQKLESDITSFIHFPPNDDNDYDQQMVVPPNFF
jgi:hypothetical protein